MPLVRARIDRVEGPNENGFYRIALSEGPFDRLDTKDMARAREAAALRGQFAEIDYSENPQTKWSDKLGRNVTYPNRYYDSARASTQQDSSGSWSPNEPAHSFDGPAATAPVFDEAAPRERSKTNAEDAWRMALSTGAKLAVDTVPMLPEDQRSFKFQKDIALAWARFIAFTPPPDSGQLQREVVAAFSGFGAGDYEQQAAMGAPPRDDDIPF